MPAPSVFLEKPRIAIVYEQDGWTFHRIALQIEKFLRDRGGNPSLFQMVTPIPFKEFDAVFAIWWGASKTWLHDLPPHVHLFPFIFDHFTHTARNRVFLRQAAFRSTAVFVAHQGLGLELHKAAAVPHDRIFLFPDAVDPDHFKFRPMNTEGRTSDSLVCGWAGNPRRGGTLKGLEIVQEACRIANVTLKTATGAIPYEDMPKWHEGIDVLICASSSEGGPNPVLESAATGRPIISTAVGLVPELFRNNTGILVERNVQSIVAAIRKMQDDFDLLPELGRSLRLRIEEKWTWGRRLPVFEKILRGFLKKSH